MKIKDFDVNDTSWLKITDLENIFNIYLDKRKNYIYNLNSSIYFNLNNIDLDLYTLNHDMHWTLISYKLYDTTRLAWVLMKLNNVQTKNIFKKIKSSESIKYIPKVELENLISILNTEEV